MSENEMSRNIEIPVVDDEIFYPIPGFEDYEINKKGDVRRINDKCPVSKYINTNGYYRLRLNRKNIYLHQIIAKTFIPNNNPDINKVVDHINHDKLDNRVENLRWTTQSLNCYNRKHNRNQIEYEYRDELPPNSAIVYQYGKHKFNNLYYCIDSNTFYLKIEKSYRSCHWIKCHGLEAIKVYDIAGKQTLILKNQIAKKCICETLT